MSSIQNLLSLIIFFPIFIGIVTFFQKKHGSQVYQLISVSFIVLFLFLGIVIYRKFDKNIGFSLQLVEKKFWFSFLEENRIDYFLGVDGISLIFVSLNLFISSLMVFASYHRKKYSFSYLGMIFLISGLSNGVFLSINYFLLYFFLETLIFPICLSICIFGGGARVKASVQYFFYMIIGSVFLLIFFLISVNNKSPCELNSAFSFQFLFNKSNNFQLFMFVSMFIPFAIKVPIWPFHSWLPEAHSQAPAEISVILASIIIKIGTYGLIRFVLPLMLSLDIDFGYTFVVASLFSIIYIGILTNLQTNFKKLIAYSSISHMGLVTLGIFNIPLLSSIQDMSISLQGSLFQIFSHSLSSAGMFISCGYIYKRVKSYEMIDFGGLAQVMPVLSSFFMFFCIANIGFPGTSGFIGELLIIYSSLKYSFLIGFLAALTLILSPIYTLSMYKKIFLGDLNKKIPMKSNIDISGNEIFVCLLIAIPIIFLGVSPKNLLSLFSETSYTFIKSFI